MFDARRLRFVVDPNPMRFFIVMIGRERVVRSDDARPTIGIDPAAESSWTVYTPVMRPKPLTQVTP